LISAGTYRDRLARKHIGRNRQIAGLRSGGQNGDVFMHTEDFLITRTGGYLRQRA
jgi:hypothetical protein